MAYNTPGEVLTDIANAIRTLYSSTSSIPFVDMPGLIKGAFMTPVDISDYSGTSWPLAFWDHLDFSELSSIDYLFSYIDDDANTPTLSLDLSTFSVTGFTSYNSLFQHSKFTEILGIESWDTSDVTNMSNTFTGTYISSSLDLSNWDTSNVTTMYNMFSRVTIPKMWVPSTFVATAVTDVYNKPFREAATSLVIYTDASSAAEQGWGTIGANIVIHYNSTYQDFINA